MVSRIREELMDEKFYLEDFGDSNSVFWSFVSYICLIEIRNPRNQPDPKSQWKHWNWDDENGEISSKDYDYDSLNIFNFSANDFNFNSIFVAFGENKWTS